MTHLVPYPGTQSARRAVALLKAFSGPGGPRSLTDLARQVRLSKATAFRLLSALESEGLVTKESESGEYRLGPETIALGWQAVQSNALIPTVRPILQTLARRTRETATLEILTGGEVVILDEVMGGRRLEIGPFVGSRWPAHATSTGKVLLAFEPTPDPLRGLNHPLRRFTDQTLTSRRALRKQFVEIRRKGFATAIEELEPGFSAVAAPVRRHDGQVVAAISVGGPTARIPSHRLEGLGASVQRESERASRALGFRAAKPSKRREA